MVDDAPEVTIELADKKIADAQTVEPSCEDVPGWRCSFCEAVNSAAQQECCGCKNSRAESDKNYFEAQELSSEKIFSDSSSEPIEPIEATEEELRKNHKKPLIIGLSVLGLGIIVLWFVFSADTVTYKVSSADWKRTISVKRYQWLEREDWINELQGDSIQKISQSNVTHHYENRLAGSRDEFYVEKEKVKIGVDKKNEPKYLFKSIKKMRKIPIYRDFPVTKIKVRYKTKMYAMVPPLVMRGANNKPKWPEIGTAVDLDGKPDKVESRAEIYSVTLEKVTGDELGPKKFVINATLENFENKYLLNKNFDFEIGEANKIVSHDSTETIMEGK